MLYAAENLLVCFTDSSDHGCFLEQLDSIVSKIMMSGSVE